jgi:amino-acid N-acetyltransferase
VSEPSIRAAGPGDLPAIESLMATAQLPAFRAADFIDTFWVAEADGEIVGCCGLEVYDDAGLLRSAVVAPHLRGTGLGRALTEAVIDGASWNGVRDLYLFTLDAGGFFDHMGFEKCTVEDFSGAGRKSTQWRAVNEHPEIAEFLTAMRMRLGG